jgi:hypothetical protein
MEWADWEDEEDNYWDEECDEEDEEEEAFAELGEFFTGLLSMTDPTSNALVTFDATCFNSSVQSDMLAFANNLNNMSELNWANETPNSVLKMSSTTLSSLGSALNGVAQSGCQAVQTLANANGFDSMISSLNVYTQNPQNLLQLANNAGYLFEDVLNLQSDCAYDAYVCGMDAGWLLLDLQPLQ